MPCWCPTRARSRPSRDRSRSNDPTRRSRTEDTLRRRSLRRPARPRPARRVGRLRRARRARLVVGVPPVAAPAHVGDRRRAVPRRAVPVLRLPGTRAPARAIRPVSVTRADVDRGRHAHRTVRRPHACTPRRRARRVDRRDGVRQGRASPAHQARSSYRGATNAVQSLSASEARARGRRALVGQSCRRARARPRTTRDRRVRRHAPDAPAKRARWSATAHGSRGATTRSTPAARARHVIARTGAIEIHPFDDERVIAGAGTAALELLDEVPDLDAIVTPIGGGGLASGTCIAAAGSQ